VIEMETARDMDDLNVPVPRSVGRSLLRGLRRRCPSCGTGPLFKRYLKTVPACSACGEDISHHRADDAPPYFTMVVVGHVVVPVMLAVQMATDISNVTHLAIWLPVTGLLSLALLQPIKGAVVGLQWALRMHGFSGEGDPEAIEQISSASPPHRPA
jgi:uncharacterized protein (DUF983 family)